MLLLQKAQAVYTDALQAGHLTPIETRAEIIYQRNIAFSIKIAAHWQQRKAARHDTAQHAQVQHNPFLPFENALHVADIDPQHVCILNKFPVLQPHLLLISRTFEAQVSPLTLQNFQAAQCLMQQLGQEGILFYNAGPTAGASQPHRHMQWIPTPAYAGINPLEHADLLGSHFLAQPGLDAQALYLCYQQGLQQLDWQPGCAYNLLLSRDWLWMIPRRAAAWQHIAINSLGFIGSFFARNQLEADQLREFGFIQALQHVVGWHRSPIRKLDRHPEQ